MAASRSLARRFEAAPTRAMQLTASDSLGTLTLLDARALNTLACAATTLWLARRKRQAASDSFNLVFAPVALPAIKLRWMAALGTQHPSDSLGDSMVAAHAQPHGRSGEFADAAVTRQLNRSDSELPFLEGPRDTRTVSCLWC